VRFTKKNKSQQSERRVVTQQTRQPVFSYRSARHDKDRIHDRSVLDDIDMEHREPVKKTHWYKKPLQYSAIVLVVVIVLLGATYVKVLGDVTVVGGGSNPATVRSYGDTMTASLRSSWMNRTFLLLDRSRISDDLMRQHPEVQNASYSYSPFTQQLDVKVSLNKAILRVSSQGQIYVADVKGRIVENAPGDINALPLVVDADNRTYKKGDIAFTTKEINYIYNIIEQARNKNLEVDNLSLQHGATELYVTFKDVKYTVKFSLDNDPRISFGNFIVARDKSGDQPKEYVDVRVVDRVYIK
jgi:hypothetical protein